MPIMPHIPLLVPEYLESLPVPYTSLTLLHPLMPVILPKWSPTPPTLPTPLGAPNAP